LEFVYLLDQIFCAQHLGYPLQLVEVVVPVKEWFLLEDDCCKHAAQTPDVQTLVLHVVIHQQFRPLEVSAGYPHRQVAGWIEELTQPPVYQSDFVLFRINHDVVRFYVPVHDTPGVTLV